MKKLILFVAILAANCISAQTSAVFPEDFIDDGLNGKNVKITNNLYAVSTVYNGTTKNVYFAEFLPKMPGETIADSNSDEYSDISYRNADTDMRLQISNLPFDMPIGARLKNIVINMASAYNNRGSYDWMYYEMEGRGPDRYDPTRKPAFDGATLLVCAANLQWYMTTISSSSSGATTQELFNRQTAKITEALSEIQADIFAFIEVEQNAGVLDTLANRLNNKLSTPGKWVAVDRGITDESSTYQSCGFIYNTQTVKPVGSYGHAISGGYQNRSPIQTFEEIASGEKFTLNCLHLKAKSSYNDNEEERMTQVQKVATSLKSYVSADPDILIVGDYNSYSAERPIKYLEEQGYTEELLRSDPDGYSYRYDINNLAPAFGYLDHVMSSATMSEQVIGAKAWHINTAYKDADYSYKKTTGTEKYRYADHDPVLIGLKLHTEPLAVDYTLAHHTAVSLQGAVVTVTGIQQSVSVFTPAGQNIFSQLTQGSVSIALPQGIYIIRADNDIHKLIVNF